tara:strand:- start:690 stop:1409 length:720 start_codon:yes stop_codon:yes gene_type:complete
MSKFIHHGEEKKKYVKDMFNDISKRYDLFNLLSSMGIDRYWRYRLAGKFKLKQSDKLLDIATGTGDVVLKFHKKFKSSCVGLDIADKMIEVANHKKEKQGLGYRDIRFIVGDAEDLGFSNDTFNALTISFGFRNLGNYDQGLSEFYRVLKPGGKIAILEFSQTNHKWFSYIFKFYFNRIVPLIGSMLSRKDAFLYLPESVDYFLDRTSVCDKMCKTGFKDVKFQNYTFGVAVIYTGIKP